MPANDKAASGNPIGRSTQTGAVAFTTTQWSVVLRRRIDLQPLMRRLKNCAALTGGLFTDSSGDNGYSPEEAQDLTQGFFALLLERRDLDVVRREKGRLRSYLLVSLKNFLAKARRRELALKRGEGRSLVPLDELLARERGDLEPASSLSADNVYERRWALTLLEQVLARLEEEYRVAGNELLFESLNELLAGESDAPSQADIAKKLGMTEHAVKQAFYRLRQRYRELLREEIAHTVAVPADVEDELRHFISVLQK